MASFLGLPVCVLTVDGPSVTGTLKEINATQGSLTLEHCEHSAQPGVVLPFYTLQRSNVADLVLLSVSAAASPAPPEAGPSRVTPVKTVSFVDPAILSMGKPSPTPTARASTAQSPLPAAPPSPPTVTIAAASPQLAQTGFSKPIATSRRRRRRQDQHLNHRGSEADESTALAHEDSYDDHSGFSSEADGATSAGREVSSDERTVRGDGRSRRGGRRPRKPAEILPQAAVAIDPYADFDFANGLSKFDKKKIFAEIRNSDQSDPALLLVSHNRRGADPRYTTKLSHKQNVLDEQSTADEADSGLDAPMPPAIPEAPLPALRNISRRTSAKSLKPLRVHGPAGPIQLVTSKQFREVEVLANIELGPSLQQRIENAGRGIAELVLDRHSGFCPDDMPGEGRPLVAILAGVAGTKGPCALRSGSHLLNRGARVVAYVPSSETLPSSFEFHLRLFSAAGGKVVRAVTDLPAEPDLVLDAYLDSDAPSTSSGINSPTASITRLPSLENDAAPASYANALAAPTLSIGWPSGLDPDTGEPLAGCTPITPAATVCLGVVRTGASAGPTVTGALWLADLGVPPTAYERVAGLEDWRSPFGRRWVVPLRYD